ncbi:MAG: N-acetylglucosamine-6-phosphate deacetylase, partial [Sulfitobacter sp.]
DGSAAIQPAANAGKGSRLALDEGIIIPGFVDLQVNGGDGIMFNDAPTLETLRRIARAHWSLGCAAILPTLITDTPAKTQAAIDATIAAIKEQVPGIIGLHLEGPHLAKSRKGAHDGALIRPMDADDLRMLLAAAARLPNLMVTLAPESVQDTQITALAEAGVLVSLGHSDCSFERAMQAFDAGAGCVTHLFNAMSQLGSRTPGLVGAALSADHVHAGLIADGVHVHPAAMRLSIAAKMTGAGVFLVSDAMAPAGSSLESFELNGRMVTRHNGRLTLPDGTLAGADLTLARAIGVLTQNVGIDLVQAITMATSGPSALLRHPEGAGRFAGTLDGLSYLNVEQGTCRNLKDLIAPQWA